MSTKALRRTKSNALDHPGTLHIPKRSTLNLHPQPETLLDPTPLSTLALTHNTTANRQRRQHIGRVLVPLSLVKVATVIDGAPADAISAPLVTLALILRHGDLVVLSWIRFASA
jgi:hypothetical protein